MYRSLQTHNTNTTAPPLSISYATLTQKLVVQISLPPNYFAAKIKSQIQSDARMEIEIFALNLQISIVIIQIWRRLFI